MKNFLEKKLISFINKADAITITKRMRRSPKRNLNNILWERASVQSADFVESHLGDALVFEYKSDIWNYAVKVLNEAGNNGVCMEFGVNDGTSINWFSNMLPHYNFVGFDSFIGLKEDWAGHFLPQGTFSQNGVLPKVNKNVVLVKGWFDEILPEYIEENGIFDLRFIHIDCDTYEGAVAVFNELGDKLKPGMLILFDELLGYPNWQNGEFKALHEAQSKNGFSFRYRAFCSHQALIEITA